MPTISIVDDDDEIRAAIKSLVQSYGLKAQGFASAEEFLQSPFAEQTACLITDVQMPGMSGVDLQDALIERDCRLPIIFISAFGTALAQGAGRRRLGFSEQTVRCIRVDGLHT